MEVLPVSSTGSAAAQLQVEHWDLSRRRGSGGYNPIKKLLTGKYRGKKGLRWSAVVNETLAAALLQMC